jgi:hypothetical protein
MESLLTKETGAVASGQLMQAAAKRRRVTPSAGDELGSAELARREAGA